MSLFSSPRSEESRLDNLGDLPEPDSEDPAAMRNWMRQMSREMGEDGEDLEGLMEEAMAEEESTGPTGEGPADSDDGSFDDL
jgi:hypothetical protein